MINTLSCSSLRFILLTGIFLAIGYHSPSIAQSTTAPSPDQFSCPRSECRLNQSSGSSTSVGVGLTSSFGVNSTAQSTSNYNASASASLVLNVFDPTSPSSSNVNSILQTVGDPASNSPITLTISTDAIQSKSKDGNDTSFMTATNYTSEENSGSSAEFDASGFKASQDLRFKGGSESVNEAVTGLVNGDPGSAFKAEVIKLLDKTGGPEVGTGNSSSGSETRTRFQADITTSTFVNAFTSSF